MQSLGLVGQVHARQPLHAVIGQQHVERALPQPLEGLITGVHNRRLMPHLLQRGPGEVRNRLGIVHHKEAERARAFDWDQRLLWLLRAARPAWQRYRETRAHAGLRAHLDVPAVPQDDPACYCQAQS